MIGKQNPQLSLLDSALSKRKKKSRTDELLKKIDEYVNWNRLESLCRGVYKDSNMGRPSIPVIVSLKCLILQYLYNLSDPGLEDALIDRISFQRFIGLSFDEEIPDFTTIWRFREKLVRNGIHDKLFKNILKDMEKRGHILKKGTLVDATIVEAARKNTPEDSGDSPQQDKDARHTQKNGKIHYGYKGHIGVDKDSDIIRRVRFTPANVHDSKELPNLISGDEKSIFADKAYSNDSLKKKLRSDNIFYGILDKRKRGQKTLTEKQKKLNKIKTKIRNAVERPFAVFKKNMGFRVVRYVNLKRNAFHFTFLCIIYNIRRGLALSVPKM
jgi:transposase, IS5 family